MSIDELIPNDLKQMYEFYNYNHALEILTKAFPEEWNEVVNCLRNIRISTDDLRLAGGNETAIPKKFEDQLYPYGWKEIRITGDLHIKFFPRRLAQRGRFQTTPYEERILSNWIDGHNIDFIKNRVALDLEWNSKDQTFDRDILAFRAYYDCDVISVGVIITRAQTLNNVFRTIYDSDGRSIMRKYGASTTWIGKLLYRLDSRRNGGCPVLAIGIKPTAICDWNEEYIDGNRPE